MAAPPLQGTVGALVNEFFSDSTSNQRKHAIECQLAELNRQEGSWIQWMQIVRCQTQPELLAFAFSALQDSIAGHRLDKSARSQLRSELQFRLLSTELLAEKQQPIFVRRKVAKMLVDLGIIDWPHNEPDFFNEIWQLCQMTDLQPLGLLMLQTFSEELSGLRRDLNRSRVDELHHLLYDELAKIWPVLTALVKKGSSGGPTVHQALQCIEHLLGWISLQSVGPELVEALCSCAAAGLTSLNSHMQEQAETIELGELSLGCLCEALGGDRAPMMNTDCMPVLEQFTIGILQTTIPPDTANSIHSSYLDKLADFLRLVIKQPLPRMLEDDDDNPHPGLAQLLSLLFNHTFREPNIERYCMYMDMWTTILIRIVSSNAERSKDYRQLVGALMDQLLVRCCQASEGTTAHSLLEPQLDLLQRAGRCFPEDACAKVLGLLEPELSHFQSPQVTTATERLRSLGNLLKALGHVTPRLGMDLSLEVALRLGSVAAYGHQLVLGADKAWVDDIANVQVALLVSLRHLVLFMSSLQVPAELMVDIALAPILDPCPEKVCKAGCSLLLLMCKDIRTSVALSRPSMQRLCDHLCQGTLRPLSSQCEQLVVQSVHAALCLQWTATPAAAQCWNQRKVAESNLVNALAQPLLQREPPGPAVERSLRLLQAMVEVLNLGGSYAKQICCTGMAPLWPVLLERLPSLQAGSEDPVLSLLESMVRVLAVQLGAERLEPLLAIVEQRVSQEREEGEVASIEWLMSLLRCIVREPSLIKFLPIVLRLCLDQVHPRLIQCPGLTPVLGPRLLDVLEQCVTCNWRHFFPGGVAAPEQTQNSQEFGRILSIFGWFMHVPEPDIVRQSVMAVGVLNRRCRLFQKVAFRESMLAQFVEAVLRCLVSSPVRDLLKDEFQRLLYELAEVDFDDFYGRLLPALVPPEELRGLKYERDRYSFNEELDRLLSSLRRFAG